MKILSYKCHGLVNPSKQSSLKRLMEHISPNVIFLQETMGFSEVIKSSLENIFPGWAFVVVDASGCSGGLASGWKFKNCNVENVWSVEFGIGPKMFVEDLGNFLTFLNIYGPYQDRVNYWESLLVNISLGERRSFSVVT